MIWSRLCLKCDRTRGETRFCLSAKRASSFKLEGASVQSTTGSQGVRISGSNAGYTISQGSVKNIGYPLHSPASPSLPLPYVMVCHHTSTGLYFPDIRRVVLVHTTKLREMVQHKLGGESKFLLIFMNCSHKYEYLLPKLMLVKCVCLI